MKSIYIILFVLLLSTSCINEWDRWLDTDYVEYEFVDDSKLFKQEYLKLDLKKFDNELIIELKTKLPSNFEFPKSNIDQQPLTNTNFHFKLFLDGEPIKVDSNIFSLNLDILDENGNLNICTSIKDISEPRIWSLKIPMYIFHNVHNGEQEIEMEIYQRHFQNTVMYDSETDSYNEKEVIRAKLIEGRIKFKLNIPKLYVTQFENEDIVLQDDDEFSPAGMDVAFLRKGYPDIYWTMGFYKSKGGNEFNQYSSPVQDYATVYTYSNKINFYHYDNTEGIELTVLDKDDFNSDDLIGNKSFKFSEIIRDDNEFVELEFNHITKFKLRILQYKILLN